MKNEISITSLKRLTLIIFFCLFYFVSHSQTDLFKKYSVEDLQQDYAQLRNHLEKKCPLSYLYVTRAEVTLALDSIGRLIDAPMTELAFY